MKIKIGSGQFWDFFYLPSKHAEWPEASICGRKSEPFAFKSSREFVGARHLKFLSSYFTHIFLQYTSFHTKTRLCLQIDEDTKRETNEFRATVRLLFSIKTYWIDLSIDLHEKIRTFRLQIVYRARRSAPCKYFKIIFYTCFSRFPAPFINMTPTSTLWEYTMRKSK